MLNFGKALTKIPFKEEWEANCDVRDYAILVFKEGSKTETGTSSRTISGHFCVSQVAQFFKRIRMKSIWN